MNRSPRRRAPTQALLAVAIAGAAVAAMVTFGPVHRLVASSAASSQPPTTTSTGPSADSNPVPAAKAGWPSVDFADFGVTSLTASGCVRIRLAGSSVDYQVVGPQRSHLATLASTGPAIVITTGHTMPGHMADGGDAAPTVPDCLGPAYMPDEVTTASQWALGLIAAALAPATAPPITSSPSVAIPVHPVREQ